MTEMTATFDPQALVDALEEHRHNINEGQWKQVLGDTQGALEHAIYSLNLLTTTLLDLVGEDNRRELRDLTYSSHGVSTRFLLDDDEEFINSHPDKDPVAN